MKNMKIRTKVLVSFGVVLMLMLAVAVSVLITNLSTMGNVTTIDEESTLQTMENEVLDYYKEARLSSSLIYNTIDPESFPSFTKNIEGVRTGLQNCYNFIAENPGLEKYRPGLEEFEQNLNIWVDEVTAVDTLDADLTAAQSHMEELNGQINDVVLPAVATLANNEAAPTAIANASDLTNTLAEMQNKVRHLMDTFENTEVDRINELLTHAQDLLENAVKNGGDKAGAYSNVLNMVNESAEQVAAYNKANNDSEVIIEQASVQETKTQQLLLDSINSIDTVVATQMDKTASSATMALVIVLVIFVVAVAVAVFMAFYLSNMLSRPLNSMRNALTQVGTTGSLSFTQEAMDEVGGYAKQKDEIGESALAFDTMMRRLLEIGGQLEQVADGDLTVETRLLSSQDTLGNALDKMVANLNNMFADIDNATTQVSSGSSQIADGAQALAQGSTEQAAAVQQLSASINEIAGKTQENAEQANKAATLSSMIRDNAQQGTVQMSEMMQAVKEINDASQNINKVIKVIDDIAFQTNILALNAAVEAARAGQHGKGFAVVAEEVRNLAAKSAEAAKDTGSLIANSMEKADLGAKIANETSASLNEIVNGINESTEIVSHIAQSSEEQTAGIKEIHTGIEQVAQVVQQNSATSEESAASSEEMSGQASMLRELVGRFRLKGQASAALPAHSYDTPGHDAYSAPQLPQSGEPLF